MRAPVRLRHDGDDGDAGRRADGLGLELGEERLALRLGQRGDHLDELGGAGEAVLAAGGGLEGVEVDGVASTGLVDHVVDDLGYGFDPGFFFGEVVGYDAAAAWAGKLSGLGHLRRRHGRGERERERGSCFDSSEGEVKGFFIFLVIERAIIECALLRWRLKRYYLIFCIYIVISNSILQLILLLSLNSFC